MASDATDKLRIRTPAAAADALGITSSQLITLLRFHRYPFTEIAIGGRPGDRGRGRWGLTLDQIRAIARGQSRQFADQPDASAGDAPADHAFRLNTGRLAERRAALTLAGARPSFRQRGRGVR